METNGTLKIIKILTLLQLGDKFNTSILKDKKALSFRVFLRFVLMVIVTALIYVVMMFLQTYLQAPITVDLLIFVLILMQIMGIFACTKGLLKTLYLSKDNPLLLSYPAKHNEVFVSKIIVYYCVEFLRNLAFLLPFMLAYGIFKHAVIHWTYYLNAVIMTIILPLICVLISALLSLPIMFIADFLKGQTIVSSLLVIAVVGGFFYLIIFFLQSLPANLELLAYYKYAITEFSKFIAEVDKYGLYLVCVRQILSTTTETVVSNLIVNYAILIGVIAGLGLMVFTLTMPFYFRIASHAVEMTNAKYKTKMKVHKTTFGTFLAKEFKLALRDSDAMLNNFIYLMLMPFLLYIMNFIFSLVNANVVGEKIILIINVCLGLTMVMVSNTSSATALSSEGNEFYLLKTSPSKTRQIAWAKIVVNLLLSTVSIIAATICVATVSNFSDKEVAYFFFTVLAIDMSHVLWSFEFDLLNPQVKEYIATGTNQDMKNANSSMALGVGLAFIFTLLLALLLFMETASSAWLKFLLIVAAFLAARIYLFVTKLSLYFDDIEM